MDTNNNIQKAKNVPPFVRYCSAIIPTMFDDSLSYYEALCALNNFLQTNVIDTINNNATVTEEYIALTNALKEYVENYFENLDVQQEINNKLDLMAEDGSLGELLQEYVQPIIDRQNEEITELNSRFNEVSQRINAAFSSSPIPVASTDDMTDTTKVYLLTTSGHWYYYDSDTSAWVDGGEYQAAVIGEHAITTSQQGEYEGYNLRTAQFNTSEWNMTNKAINASGIVINAGSGNNFRCIKTRLVPNSFITVKRSTSTNRFNVGLSTSKPDTNVQLDMINTDADKAYVTFYTGSYQWVCVQTTSQGEDCDVDVIVENYNKLSRTITPKNLMPFVPVTAGTELYNPNLKVNGRGTRGSATYHYAYVNDPTYRSYVFALTENATYTVERDGGNAFRVCLWNDMPIPRNDDNDTGAYAEICRPAYIVIDDASETECTFSSSNYKYCTILYATNSSATEATFSIKSDTDTYELSKQWYSTEVGDGGVYVFNPELNPLNEYWEKWDGRLAYGMNTAIAPVPVQMESQLFVDGTIIAHNNSTTTAAAGRGYNRWGLHLYEGYSRDNYSRMTMLTDKHINEFGDSKKSLEYYYYTGASHKEDAYGNTKIGSDVNKHSFAFNRDKMIASGVIDCLFPIQVARINTTTDLDDTYTTVASADTAHEAESDADANIKCLKWIYLKNATNGAMFYDTLRQKLVVKIGNQWHDVQTTPVPNGTYNFEQLSTYPQGYPHPVDF